MVANMQPSGRSAGHQRKIDNHMKSFASPPGLVPSQAEGARGTSEMKSWPRGPPRGVTSMWVPILDELRLASILEECGQCNVSF